MRKRTPTNTSITTVRKRGFNVIHGSEKIFHFTSVSIQLHMTITVGIA
jgi:hypothetical protein